MKNFWANGNSNPTSGSLFNKKSSISPAATPPGTTTPPPKAASSARMPGLSLSTPAPLDPTSVKVPFDHDYACGVFVGAFAIPTMTVTLDVVEVTDPTTKRVERTENWLRTNDMLAILTREYGKAQQKLAALPPGAAKDRDDATRRLTEVRDQVVCVLHSRRAYHRVKEAGIRVLIEI
ncbi:hypothetical protein [Limnoglobus roseus]|uniref:Uncharacterized protein n=1 Tax=Limnoglobus roseus TaxID=2598579 RepID=A0A5C1A504_9BACT|nr:hypothetical protein [Limnoglobus roseus]QEL14191.1 hypothetical protein PX52LOC_01061 [Limnoglobus roseus]